MHPVLDPVVLDVVQALGVRRALVVVAHDPDHLGPEVGRHRRDELPEQGVRRRLGLVGEVAGEHQDLGSRVEPGHALERQPEPVFGVDHAVLPLPVGEQVRVGEVRDDVPRCGVLAELDHDGKARASAAMIGP